jgi:peptidyl-prolyl cis-trans isomerase SurA
MTSSIVSRLVFLSMMCAATLAVMGGQSPLHAQVAVMVNGEPITNYDIEQRIRLDVLSTHKRPSRKDVIQTLIDEKIKIKEGKKYGVNPTGADIDSAFAKMGERMHLSPEQLAKTLEGKGIRPDTLKDRIKADMVWNSLVRGRFKDSLRVSDRAVRLASDENGDGKPDGQSYKYFMRPVVLIVPRGSPASVTAARRKEAEALRSRIDSCDEVEATLRSVRNATLRDTVTKTSADLPKPLRELLNKTPIGHLNAPELTGQGIEMVALCARKVTSADTPEQREIREKMYAKKFEAKSKDYLADIRKAAMIEYR